MKNWSEIEKQENFEQVNDLFTPKPAFERQQGKENAFYFSIVFNALSLILCGSLVFSFDFPPVQKAILSFVLVAILVVIELSKRNYGITTISFKLAARSAEQTGMSKANQARAFQESKKARPKFYFFIASSIIIASIAGYKDAHIIVGVNAEKAKAQYEEATIDPTFALSLQVARENHTAALQSDPNDIASHRRAKKGFDEAKKKFDAEMKKINELNAAEKKRIELINGNIETVSKDDKLLYGALAAILSIIVELLSFFWLYEYLKLSNEILISYKENASIQTVSGQKQTTTLSENSASQSFIIKKTDLNANGIPDADEEAELLRKLAETQKRGGQIGFQEIQTPTPSVSSPEPIIKSETARQPIGFRRYETPVNVKTTVLSYDEVDYTLLNMLHSEAERNWGTLGIRFLKETNPEIEVKRTENSIAFNIYATDEGFRKWVDNWKIRNTPPSVLVPQTDNSVTTEKNTVTTENNPFEYGDKLLKGYKSEFQRELNNLKIGNGREPRIMERVTKKLREFDEAVRNVSSSPQVKQEICTWVGEHIETLINDYKSMSYKEVGDE